MNLLKRFTVAASSIPGSFDLKKVRQKEMFKSLANILPVVTSYQEETTYVPSLTLLLLNID